MLLFNDLIEKTRIHVQKTMLLWRDLKLPVTPSAYLCEEHILNQMSSIEEDPLELRHQISKQLERRYKSVTDFTQS